MVSVMIVRSRIRPQDRMLFQEDLTRQLRVHVSVGRLHGLRSKFREGLRAEEKLVGVSGAALRVAEAGNGVLLGTVQ
jgi:hypothetical protein